MSNSSPAAAGAGVDRRRILFVKLYGTKPDGSGLLEHLRRIYSPSRFPSKSLVINFPSFNSSSMGGGCGMLFYLGECEGELQSVIFNPVMGHFKFLPPSGVKRPEGSNLLIVTGCGFGFDSLREDYKVIRFVMNCLEKFDEKGCYDYGVPLETQVEVYSLESNSWKEIPVSEDDVFCISGSGVYVNGKCYWKERGRVTSFDFAKESFSSVPLPELKEVSNRAQCGLDLHEYKGSLAVIWYERGPDMSFEAWVLKEEEEEKWHKLFDVKPPSCYICRTLGFGKNGGVLFLEGVLLLEGDVKAGYTYAVQFGEDKYGTALIEFDLFERRLTQHPIFHEKGSMQIFSFSFDNIVFLEDAQTAIPIEEEGGESIDIFPSVVESTSAKQKRVVESTSAEQTEDV